MRTVRDVCKYVSSVIVDYPTCIETGCTYAVIEENLIHTTTNNIFEYIVQPKNGIMFSLDIDKQHIEYAKLLVSKLVAHGTAECLFTLGDSVESLKEMCSAVEKYDESWEVDFLCLDSKEFDEDHMVNEYNSIKDVLSEKHFVLADDIHNQNSVKYKKMVPILKDLGYDYVEVPTPTGLFVATKGYKLP